MSGRRPSPGSPKPRAPTVRAGTAASTGHFRTPYDMRLPTAVLGGQPPEKVSVGSTSQLDRCTSPGSYGPAEQLGASSPCLTCSLASAGPGRRPAACEPCAFAFWSCVHPLQWIRFIARRHSRRDTPRSDPMRWPGCCRFSASSSPRPTWTSEARRPALVPLWCLIDAARRPDRVSATCWSGRDLDQTSCRPLTRHSGRDTRPAGPLPLGH